MSITTFKDDVSFVGNMNVNGGEILFTTTKVTENYVTFPNCKYASVPTPSIGMTVLITDALKPGETTGSGTGCLCVYDGSNWVNISTGTTVTV